MGNEETRITELDPAGLLSTTRWRAGVTLPLPPLFRR